MLPGMASRPQLQRALADRRAHLASPPAHARPAREGARAKAADQGWPSDPQAIQATAGGDMATRIAVIGRLERTAGNAATAQLLRAEAPAVQREPPDGAAKAGGSGGTGGDAVTAAAAYMLSNARFTGQPRLQDIASGGASLSNKDKKAVVKPVQTALLDVGYSLLRYKDDGDFGPETRTAIEQFRSDSKITDGEGFNASAMKVLDKRAPAPGKQEEHYLDYARLFADDRLDVTLAIGYDEGQAHTTMLEEARAWFGTNKFTKAAGAETAKPTAPEGAGEVDPKAAKGALLSVPETWTAKRAVTYPGSDGARITKDITVSVTLVPPGTGAKASFAKGLNDSELTLYAGHARRGIGPDFDPDKSAYENFVIGVNSALHKAGRVVGPNAVAKSHYVIDKKNDLEQMQAASAWKTDKYRVWFFGACSSVAYFDELRGGLLPEKMDRHNLDLFGTTQSIPIAAGLVPVFSNLEGILAAETMEQIVARMQRSSFEAFRKKVMASEGTDRQKEQALKSFPGDWFLREGAGDNPIASGTP